MSEQYVVEFPGLPCFWGYFIKPCCLSIFILPNPLYTYVLNIYCLVWFYGISTIVCYLMLNPLYIYIYIYIYIWFVNTFCKKIFLNEPELFLNGFKYCYITVTIKYQSFVSHIVCFIWPVDRALSGANSPSQSGSNTNKEVLHVPQISTAGPLSSDGLMLFSALSLCRQRCSGCILQL